MLMKHSLIYFFLFLVINFSLGLTASFAQDISISPVVLKLNGKPGETINSVIKISNSGKSTYEFQVSIKDWKRDSIGTKIYSEPGTTPHSNAKWVSFPETDFSLKAGERKEFPIYLQIPRDIDLSQSSNSMLFITQVNPFDGETNNKAIGIKVSYEFGVQLLYTPPMAELGDLVFQNLEFNSKTVENKSLVKVTIQNTGSVHKNGAVSVELTNKITGEEFKLNPKNFAIMPLDTQYIYFKIPDSVIPGEYLLIALLDAGKDTDLKVAEKNIHVQD